MSSKSPLTSAAPILSGDRGGYSKAKPLAARLGISSRTLFRWADAGHINRHKVNSRVVLFNIDETFAFINDTRVGREQSVDHHQELDVEELDVK